MDQVDTEKLALFRERLGKHVVALRNDLNAWIKKHNGPLPPCDDIAEAEFRGPYVEITTALLETAIDRVITLHGGIDAREFILKTFDNRLSLFKRGLQ